MANRIIKRRYREKTKYKYFIYIVIFIALLQLLILKIYYQEKTFKIPENMFISEKDFPISELILDITYGEPEPELTEDSGVYETEEDSSAEPDENYSSELGSMNLTDIQKTIVIRTLELLDEDIKYGYEVFSGTGYPDNNIWISTDVISVTLNDCGYDLMNLIYDDMNNHKEDYPMDIKGGRAPIKYIDFRDVFFQEKFFKRNALILPNEYDTADENNNFIWQPGDVVYFQFDEDDPYMDLGGFVSPHKNADGIPLVIMISGEFNKVSEVDRLLEYKIVGHYRYPPPDID